TSQPAPRQARAGASKAMASASVDVANSRVTLKFREGSGIRLRGGVFVPTAGADVAGVNAVLQRFPGTAVSRLFQRSEEELAREKATAEARSRRQQAALNLCYRLVAAEGADVAALIGALDRLDVVEAASSEPKPATPTVTPDLSAQQGYRFAAPDGVGATLVANFAGGKGQNIEITDIEYSSNVNHEDLTKAPGALIATARSTTRSTTSTTGRPSWARSSATRTRSA
ncbi:MAG: hypothetical protein ACRD2W_01150, partial [Acidimicrobiales bacterium]